MYKLVNNQYGDLAMILRLNDNAYIPIAPDNVDFQQYQKWLSEGNTPIPADENA